MNEKYTCDITSNDTDPTNARMCLPIFASTSLKQELKSSENTNFWLDKVSNTASEILGEISISFAFTKESEKNIHKEEIKVRNPASIFPHDPFQPAEKELPEPCKRITASDDTTKTKTYQPKEDV